MSRSYQRPPRGKVLVWEPPGPARAPLERTGEWAYDADFLTELEITFVSEGPSGAGCRPGPRARERRSNPCGKALRSRCGS